MKRSKYTTHRSRHTAHHAPRFMHCAPSHPTAITMGVKREVRRRLSLPAWNEDTSRVQSG